jgi:hypothetical protein
MEVAAPTLPSPASGGGEHNLGTVSGMILSIK